MAATRTTTNTALKAVTSRHVRILVVEPVELEAKLITRALADCGFSDVVHVCDADTALAKLDDGGFFTSIVIADFDLRTVSGIDLVRRVRERGPHAPYVYMILLAGRSTLVRLREAFDAGTDDYLAKPYERDELLARVHAARRVVTLERSLFIRANELETTLRKVDAIEAVEALARAAEREAWKPLNAAEALIEQLPWETLQNVLGDALTSFSSLDLSQAVTSNAHAAVVGEVFMSDPAKQLELGISVVIGGPSMQRFSEKIIGATDFESGCELVLETANVLMGAAKSAASERGYDFAAGLPTRPNLLEARSSYDARAIRQRFAFRAAADDIDIEIWVWVSERRNSRIRGVDLREGMVVAEDVHDERGMLLIRGGVRLTATTAERLAKLAPKLEVVVANAA